MIDFNKEVVMPTMNSQEHPQVPERTRHPVIAALGLLTTGALVAAVLAGLAKGFASLR